MKIVELFDIENGEELAKFFLKSDVILLACVFEKPVKISVNGFGRNPLNCDSLSGYTW